MLPLYESAAYHQNRLSSITSSHYERNRGQKAYSNNSNNASIIY